MIRRGIFGAVVLVSLTGGFQTAHAQNWIALANPPAVANPNVGDFLTPYFLNSDIGFTFSTGILTSDNTQFTNEPWTLLARTTDGGISWISIPFFDSISCAVDQLCFVSLQHGYAAVQDYAAGVIRGDSDNSGIYETLDQGTSWKKISKNIGIHRTFVGVYATPLAVFATETSSVWYSGGVPVGMQLIFSRDDGLTWDSVEEVHGALLDQPYTCPWVYGNRDSLVATVYFDSDKNTHLVYSTNLGISWQTSFLDSNYYWPIVTLYIPAHSCNIFRQFLDSQDIASQINQFDNDTLADTWSFLEATPPYTDWDSSLMHTELGGWIAGNSCALYVSYSGQWADEGSLQRSTNNGLSWASDGTSHVAPDFNEIDDYDYQNLSVVGYGSVIYGVQSLLVVAGNSNFNVPYLYKSTDGGDGTLSEAALVPRLEFGHGMFATGNDTLAMTTCSPSSAVVFYQNLSCAITKLDSISITGLTPAQFSLTSTHHNDCLSLPDTTYVSFLLDSTGTYPITAQAHFIDDEYNTIDTTLNFTLVVYGGTSTPLNLYFKFPTITTAAGDTLEIPVYLSGNTTLDSTSITLPFGIDTNVMWPIGFHSVIPGLSNDTLIFSNGNINVPLHSDSIVLNGETLIGYLRCIVYLADTLATSVTLQSTRFTSVNAPCVTLSLTTDSVNILINGCGDQTLLQYMKTGRLLLDIKSIVPNPSSDAVQVNFVNPTSSAISYQVVDVLGTVRAVGSVIGTALTLDVHSLPNGLYYMRARNMATNDISSGKFVVER